jgi:hypothetical protein
MVTIASFDMALNRVSLVLSLNYFFFRTKSQFACIKSKSSKLYSDIVRLSVPCASFAFFVVNFNHKVHRENTQSNTEE